MARAQEESSTAGEQAETEAGAGGAPDRGGDEHELSRTEAEGPSPEASHAGARQRSQLVLLLAVFVVAVCGLVYELLAGTLSSYLEGESVYQFSLVIGLFMSSMGLGSFLSRYIRHRLIDKFVAVEIAVGLLGGSTAAVLFFSYAFTQSYSLIMVGFVVTLGTLIGLEIPLVTRIMREYAVLRITLAEVFSFDYMGALVAAILFPIVFVPYLGLMRTSFCFGLLNVAVGWALLLTLKDRIERPRPLYGLATVSTLLLCAGLIWANSLNSVVENNLYRDPIIFSKQTTKQKIVLTRWKGDVRMFIDGNIQFCSTDEYRYHEALVHPAASLAPRHQNVLVLGGGDGLAVREVLKYSDVKRIDLVDFDPEITKLAKQLPHLRELNEDSLLDPRVHLHHQDAYKYLEETSRTYDLIFVDLPDPNNLSLGKLYTRSFYTLCYRRLNRTGFMALQSTSPYFAKKAFWCIHNTLVASPRSDVHSRTFFVKPYHAFVPSFGDWGFQLVSRFRFDPKSIRLRVKTKFLTNELIPGLFALGKDCGPMATPVNTLNNQALVGLYEQGWKQWN